jgi:hypothetical protein
MKLKKWTKDEVDILTSNWNIPMRELLDFLPDRDRKTIYWKLKILGFDRQTFKSYTKEDDDFIAKNYQLKGNFEIGREIKRTAKSISKRMIILGLKRTDSELTDLKRTNRGCFKKGKISEKTIPNGNLRLTYDEKTNRTFYNIKIDKKIVRFSRYLYEHYYQEKLKATDVIFHLDGDGMNVLKENLVKITRSELLSKNIMSDEAFVKRIFRIKDPELIEGLIKNHPEMIDLKKKMITIKQKINGRTREINGIADK